MSCHATADAADSEEHGKGNREDDDGGSGGTAGVAALDAAEHVDGDALGLEGKVARDQYDRPELADRTCKSERDAGEDRRQDVRQDHAPEGGEARGTERR